MFFKKTHINRGFLRGPQKLGTPQTISTVFTYKNDTDTLFQPHSTTISLTCGCGDHPHVTEGVVECG